MGLGFWRKLSGEGVICLVHRATFLPLIHGPSAPQPWSPGFVALLHMSSTE
jgi:hypothetical protein